MPSPYIQGQDAAFDGKEMDDNPYKGEGEEDQKLSWDEGFVDAEMEEGEQPPPASPFNML